MEPENGSGKNGYWRILATVAITLVFSMTSNYFLFVKNQATIVDLALIEEKHGRKMEAIEIRLARVEQIQNQRTSNVEQVSRLSGEVVELKVSVGILARDVEGLRRNMRDFRDVLYEKTSKTPME